MLGGSSGVTIKTNKVPDPYNENGQSTIINVNQIRLDMPSSRALNAQAQDDESEKGRNPSVEYLDEEEDDNDGAPKLLKGSNIKSILSIVSSPSANEERK